MELQHETSKTLHALLGTCSGTHPSCTCSPSQGCCHARLGAGYRICHCSQDQNCLLTTVMASSPLCHFAMIVKAKVRLGGPSMTRDTSAV